jgi:peptidoglycan/LPS O-acetylase OafA/YrhL
LESHVKILGLVNILVGAFGALVSLIFFGVFGGASAGTDEFPLRGFVIVGLMVVMLVLAIPMIATGIGLLRFRPWARSAGTILAVFSLMHFPAGTIAGLYSFWVLLSPETDPLFNPRFSTLHLRKP